MNKLNVTRKWVHNNFDNIISVPYCDLQYLLRMQTPSWYTSGIYGWNADIYFIDMETCIVTGYRPFGNIESDVVVNEVFNRAARKIHNSTELQILLNTYIERTLNHV